MNIDIKLNVDLDDLDNHLVSGLDDLIKVVIKEEVIRKVMNSPEYRRIADDKVRVLMEALTNG